MKRKLMMLVLSVSLAFSSVSVYAQTEVIESSGDYYKVVAYDTAEERGVDPYLIQAQVYQESRWVTDAKNGKCIGLMQINPTWQKERMEELGLNNLEEPIQNLQCGIDFMGELIEKHNGNVHYALMEYNGGPDYLKRMIKAGKTSSSYSRAIVKRADEYRQEQEK